jgi:hypothetical protein
MPAVTLHSGDPLGSKRLAFARGNVLVRENILVLNELIGETGGNNEQTLVVTCAQLLMQHYISIESALNHHGIIMESVLHQYASVLHQYCISIKSVVNQCLFSIFIRY